MATYWNGSSRNLAEFVAFSVAEDKDTYSSELGLTMTTHDQALNESGVKRISVNMAAMKVKVHQILKQTLDQVPLNLKC